MTTHTDQAPEEGEYELPYKTLFYHARYHRPIEIYVGRFIEYANSLLAVHWLKRARQRICDSFVEEDEEFPYQNHYGPLTQDPHNK